MFYMQIFLEYFFFAETAFVSLSFNYNLITYTLLNTNFSPNKCISSYRLWDKINRGTGSSNYARHPYMLTLCQYDHLFFVPLSIQTTFCQPKIQIQNCFANNILEDMSLSRSQILPLYPSISMNHSKLHFFLE